MPRDPDLYDFFVSYARDNNADGWITQFVEELVLGKVDGRYRRSKCAPMRISRLSTNVASACRVRPSNGKST